MARDTISGPERITEQPVSAGQPESQPSTAPISSQSGAAASFLDASSAFEGVIRSGEPLRLDGRVKGEIHCEQRVVIGESARIEATIRADVVAIAGEVRGEVHAARKITLAATARMVGELTTPAIAIEEGAELVGRAQIGTRRPTSERQPHQKAEAEDRPRDARSGKPSANPLPPTA
jgi:cytoskeletal protein CcmA (bactofilin family)